MYTETIQRKHASIMAIKWLKSLVPSTRAVYHGGLCLAWSYASQQMIYRVV